MSGVMREITIRPVLNGFVVSVGCQKLVFPTMGELTCALIDYQRDPDATEKKFIAEAVNKTMNDGPAPSAGDRVVFRVAGGGGGGGNGGGPVPVDTESCQPEPSPNAI